MLAVPIGIAALRVRGASFVIVSIALVLILLLVFQSWGDGHRRLERPARAAARSARTCCGPSSTSASSTCTPALLAVALLVWWADRPLPLRHRASRRSARTRTRRSRSACPTFAYKLVAFVVSAFFTALGGGLYALWFGYLDPIFQFSILVGSYMVLMCLLGGVRSLFGPLLGAVVVGYALEYFKAQYGDTQFHLVAIGLLLGLVVLFMPDGIIPAVAALVNRFRPQAASIREVTAGELAEQRRTAPEDERGTTADPAPTTTSTDRLVRTEPAMSTTTAAGPACAASTHRRPDQVVRRRDAPSTARPSPSTTARSTP